MSHNPELIAEVRAWYTKAAHDLRMAELAFEDRPPMTDQAVYHAQQAAEKAMKGLLTWHERIFRKTHNLVELGESCAELYPYLENLLRRAACLSDYSWQYRYPGEIDEDDDQVITGARIPIPAETFLEELSQKLEIHPISV
jgi:HEPN domain-containing protein